MQIMIDRFGFTLDLNRCTGCRACELACSTENDLAFGQSWRRIETFNSERDPRAPHHHLSIACNHCENAPCVEACPTDALGLGDLAFAGLLGLQVVVPKAAGIAETAALVGWLVLFTVDRVYDLRIDERDQDSGVNRKLCAWSS